ncbi:MAG: hypothetical protein GY935_27100 [Gammaproteobacteria bacterium]|nr:hypothetical protein [Gammaproteobacteria bacterium]
MTNTPDLVGDDTCISCHTSLAGTRLPYGQLDLTSDPNQDPNDFLRSFVEMFINKPGRMFDGANLVPFTVLDGMGNTINNPQSVVSPTMTTAGARSSYFIEKMSGTELDDTTRAISGSVDHSAMLTGAELKLISEWIDLGAQNFNDPFDPAAPQN